MSDPIFALDEPIRLPIRGQDGTFAINRIFCVGRNYAAHAAEMGNQVDYEAPFYFTTSVMNARLGGAVAYPSGTTNLHHEVELVVALSSGGADIAQSDALSCIYGYGVGLDMTRRDVQQAAKDKRRPWCLGKDFEGGAIFSALTTKDAFGTLSDKRISLLKNHEEVQSSPLSLMVHDVPALIAHLSQFYTLTTGDIIMTGTPEGVGPVSVGDKLVAHIDGADSLEVIIV